MNRNNKKHMIDFIFPVVLFFVFALCALAVLLLSAGIYQSTTEHSARAYNARTGLSYISEKIHQNDVNGGVRIGTLDGQEALILTQTHEDVEYSTYIYTYNNELKELFLKENATADPTAGTTILDVQDFQMEQLGPHLFQFSCTDGSGEENEITVATRS